MLKVKTLKQYLKISAYAMYINLQVAMYIEFQKNTEKNKFLCVSHVYVFFTNSNVC